VQSIAVAQETPRGGAIRTFSTTGASQGRLGGFTGSRSVAAPRSAADPATFTTASGLQVTRISPPTGTTGPTDASTVNVDYVGVLLANGTVFDSGTGSSFAVTGVVAGFREALKLMKVGEVVKVVIPSAAGYGATGSPPKIPANADLVFFIRLNSFK
jgi:FKBP-type peptidyl-prolyl cis-trans isomerase FklB